LAISLALFSCRSGVTPIRAHFNKGVYHYSRGDFDAAISEYRLALEDERSDYQARFNLAEALESKADLMERRGDGDAASELRQEAEEQYRTILTEKPADVRASVNLAALELAQGKRQAAESRLQATIDRHPGSPLPRVAMAAHLLRESAGEMAPVEEAQEILTEALDRDPGSVGANMLLGYAYDLEARLGGSDPSLEEKARRAFDKALDGYSRDVATLLALARLEQRVGEPEAATRWLRMALHADPRNLDAHLLMADSLEAVGDLEGATRHLWLGRRLEDERAPKLAPEEYSRRLLALYQRLAESERKP
jgi:tetratricopeptide (TPR) repeat protein